MFDLAGFVAEERARRKTANPGPEAGPEDDSSIRGASGDNDNDFDSSAELRDLAARNLDIAREAAHALEAPLGGSGSNPTVALSASDVFPSLPNTEDPGKTLPPDAPSAVPFQLGDDSAEYPAANADSSAAPRVADVSDDDFSISEYVRDPIPREDDSFRGANPSTTTVDFGSVPNHPVDPMATVDFGSVPNHPVDPMATVDFGSVADHPAISGGDSSMTMDVGSGEFAARGGGAGDDDSFRFGTGQLDSGIGSVWDPSMVADSRERDANAGPGPSSPGTPVSGSRSAAAPLPGDRVGTSKTGRGLGMGSGLKTNRGGPGEVDSGSRPSAGRGNAKTERDVEPSIGFISRSGRGGGARRSIDVSSGNRLLMPSVDQRGGGADDESWSSGPGAADFLGYHLLKVLGHGGMGVVYKARQQGLNRLVALKMIRGGGHAPAGLIERFQVEAEAVARLDHPNIVRIYDIGMHDDMPYISLELLEGGDLADKLAGKPLEFKAAAELIVTLAKAMHAAHRQEIIHRDLKPANIMFSADGVPKITDFGLAKKLESEAGNTVDGQIIGTPSYMPPEQAKGLVNQLRPAVDIYALGAILYECLTGRPPFLASTPMATVFQVVHEEPVPPSRLVSKIPRDLETICLKCLAKDPAKRYATALELAEDLERHLRGEPIKARRTPPHEIAFKWMRRHPAATLLIGLSVAGLFGGVHAWTRYRENLVNQRLENERRALAEQQRDAEELDRKRSETIAKIQQIRAFANSANWGNARAQAEVLIDRIDNDATHGARLAELREEAVQARDVALRAEREQEAAAARAAAAAREREILARFNEAHDQALYLDTRYTGLSDVFDPARTREVARQALRLYAVDPDKAAADDSWKLKPFSEHLPEADRARVRRGFNEALLVLAQALVEPLPGEDPAEQARKAVAALDRLEGDEFREAKGVKLRRARYLALAGDREAEAAELAAAAPLKLATSHDYQQVGWEEYLNNRFPEAIKHLEEANRLDGGNFWARVLLAISYIQQQRYNEAKITLSTCLGDRQTPWLYLLRAFVYTEEANTSQVAADVLPSLADEKRREAALGFQNAAEDYEAADAILRERPDGILRYALLVNRGLMRYRLGELDRAAEDLEEATRAQPGQYHAHLASAEVRRSLASEARAAGRDAEANEALDRAARDLDAAVAIRPDLPLLHRARARVLSEIRPQTDSTRARVLADLDTAIDLETRAGETAKLAEDLALKAELLLETDRPEEALEAAERAVRIDPGSPRANTVRLTILIEMKRFDEALATRETLDPTLLTPEILQVLGTAQAGLGRFSRAIDDFGAAIRMSPRSSTLYAYRGWAYLATEALRLADEDFTRALELDPTNANARGGRATARVRQGRLREAIEDAAASVELSQRSPRMLYGAARVHALAADQAARARESSGGPAAEIAESPQNLAAQAQALLREAIDRTPEPERDELAKAAAADPLFRDLRRRFGPGAASR